MLAADRETLFRKYKFLKGSIVVIEGNIASGKSTLCEKLTEFLNSIGLKTQLYKEPILQSYLDTFLQNQPKYAFGFQMAMLIENQCLYGDATSFIEGGGIAVMDRSFMGNRVFARVQHAFGNIDDKEMTLYDDVFGRIKAKSPDYIIYLTVKPEINIQRCALRDRTCEAKTYDLDYFTTMNKYYDATIAELQRDNNVMIIDWNKDIPASYYSTVLLGVLDDLRTNYLAL